MQQFIAQGTFANLAPLNTPDLRDVTWWRDNPLNVKVATSSKNSALACIYRTTRHNVTEFSDSYQLCCERRKSRLP